MQTREESIGTPSAAAIHRPKTVTAVLWPLLFSATMMVAPLAASALQVSPTYQVFEVKAGGKTDGQMTVTNNEGESITVTPDVKEWFKLDVNADHNVGDWIKLDSYEPFTLAPGEAKSLTYKILAPKKAKGELAGAITLSTKPKANMITLQLSVVQYAAIKGTEKVDMQVAGLGVEISSNTKIGVMVGNKGNVHIRPRGYIYVDNPKGKRVTNVEIPIGQPAFPGSGRVYVGEVKGFRLPPGEYVARIELTDVDRPIEYPTVKKNFIVNPDGKVEVR